MYIFFQGGTELNFGLPREALPLLGPLLATGLSRNEMGHVAVRSFINIDNKLSTELPIVGFTLLGLSLLYCLWVHEHRVFYHYLY